MTGLRKHLARLQLPLAVLALGVSVALVGDILVNDGNRVEALLAAVSGLAAGALGLPRPGDEPRSPAD